MGRDMGMGTKGHITRIATALLLAMAMLVVGTASVPCVAEAKVGTGWYRAVERKTVNYPVQFSSAEMGGASLIRGSKLFTKLYPNRDYVK